jgi:hypothetical protein
VKDFFAPNTVFNEVIVMAKRRNLKKEKAERNLANARQYRKRFNPNSSHKRFTRTDNRKPEGEQSSEKESQTE